MVQLIELYNLKLYSFRQRSLAMACEHWHCEGSAPPRGSPRAHPGQACGPHSPHSGDSEPVQDTWHPYWVRCKFHGWQQCPTCSAEIMMCQWPASCWSYSQRPCKRPRPSPCDDLQSGRIEPFWASLSTEQMSVTATLLMEQYISRSAISATPHADDVAGVEVSRLVAKSVFVCPGNDPPWDESSKGVQVVSSLSYCCDHWDFGYSQLPFVREGLPANADVDVSCVFCTVGKMVSMSFYVTPSFI